MGRVSKVTKAIGNWSDLSANRKIFTSIIVITSISLIVKIVAMGKDVLVANIFGTGDELDAFLIAFLLPQLFINIIAGSFVSSLVPVLTATIENSGKKRAQQLAQEALLLAILMLIIITVLLVITIPVVIPFIASGFSAEKLNLTKDIYLWLMPLLIINGVSVFYAGILNTEHSFAIPALLPIFTPLSIFLILLLQAETLGIYGIVWGLLSGGLIEFAGLAFALQQSGWKLLPFWQGFLTETKKLLSQYAPMIAGAFLMSGTVFVDQAMAAMGESGSVAALNYGNKILALILGLGAMALGTVVLPHFSGMVAKKDWNSVRTTLSKYIKIILWVSIPATFVFIVLSEWMVSLVFERGQFSSENTKLVATIQIYYAFQIPFYLLAILGVKLINALHQNKVLLYIAVVNLVVNIIGNLILVRLIGVGGIALSTSIVSALSCLLIYYYLARVEKNEVSYRS